jgi:hypothetical protein
MLGVSPASHPAFRIFTSFKGFFFLLRHPTLRLFAPFTGFLLLFCVQLAYLFLGGIVLGRVGTNRRWPPSVRSLARRSFAGEKNGYAFEVYAEVRVGAPTERVRTPGGSSPEASKFLLQERVVLWAGLLTF